MKKFIQTLKNIWSIDELRNKILFTLLLVFIYRFGSYIVLPGIDPNKLDALGESTKGGMLGLLDVFKSNIIKDKQAVFHTSHSDISTDVIEENL